MKRDYEYFVIKDPKNNYGLPGTYETAEEALAYINQSYRNALSQGYDNRHEKWIIIRVSYKCEYDNYGNFLIDTTNRMLWDHIEYSLYEDAFVVCV